MVKIFFIIPYAMLDRFMILDLFLIEEYDSSFQRKRYMAQAVLWKSAQPIAASFVERVTWGIALTPIAMKVLEKIGHTYPKRCCSQQLSEGQKTFKASLMAISKAGQMATALSIIHPEAITQKIGLVATYSLLLFYTHLVSRTEGNRLYHQIGCGVNMALEIVVQLVNAFILGAAAFKFIHPIAAGFMVLPVAFFSLIMWHCNWICDGGHLSRFRGDVFPISIPHKESTST